MLADMNNNPLDPPAAPFGLTPSGSQTSLAADQRSNSNVSLAANYIPTKFSNTLLSPGPRKRKGKGLDIAVPKRGGGVEAFRSGEARMPNQNDEDYDGVSSGWFGGGGPKSSTKRLRWNRFKWTLIFSNAVLTAWSITGLIFCLLTWFNVFTNADVVRVGNRTELVISTIAALIGIGTSLIGWAGILLNNRAFLAVYSFMCWIVFAFLVVPGYITYRRRTFNLEGKVNAQWSRDLGTDGRLRVQNQLGCCGYFSPFIEATVSQTCYSRSILPGCKLKYIVFQRMALKRWYIISFGLVPVQIFIMTVGLLCSEHITYRWGKGMMPKAYRLSMGSMAVIMDNYANQLADQYGSEMAGDIIARSRSNLALDSNNNMSSMPYAAQSQGSSGYQHTKYDSVGGRPAPEGAS